MVETLGGKSPGLVFLTAGLSRPFRRLERYSGKIPYRHKNLKINQLSIAIFNTKGCLQELERHMEEFHPDRGDTQRSVFIFQNLAVI